MLLDRFVHHKRFGRFRRLFDRPVPAVRSPDSLPRRLFIYWDQGIETAPELVRMCVDSWRRHNPGWEIVLLDHAAAEAVVPRGSLPASLKTTPYSDILRTELLRREGGVWADATVLCLQPLDQWLALAMAQCDFFAFSSPGEDRAIGSWFLAARPGSTIVAALSDAVTHYWRGRAVPTRVYHWIHYIFEYLERTSPRFRREWRAVPKLSAVPLVTLQPRLIEGGDFSESERAFLRAMPMHKLTYKAPIDLDRLRDVLGL